MAIWVEIHCDDRTAGSDGCGAPLCHGMNRSQPAAMAKDATSVPEVLRDLKAVALKAGWFSLRGSWTCPECRKSMNNA